MEQGMNSTVGFNFWRKKFGVEPKSAVCTDVFKVADAERSVIYKVLVLADGKFSRLLIHEQKGKTRRIYVDEQSVPKAAI